MAHRGLAPLGLGYSFGANLAAVVAAVGGLLGVFWAFLQVYDRLLAWALRHKLLFLIAPVALVLFGSTAWLGVERLWGWAPLPEAQRQALTEAMPGFGREFMPPFDEGSFLYMPTTTPHASVGQALEQLRLMDAAIKAQVPEVDEVVGKLGRVDSALDPAPVSMFETVITYKDEWRTGPDGTRQRQWRDHIESPDDIWTEIQRAAEQPGLTSAPKLMPINTRLVMLQSGMRAPLGVKVQAPDLEALERATQALERELSTIQGVRPGTAFAEEVVGKPYLEVVIDREALGRHGLTVGQVQRAFSLAVGGPTLTRAIDGRERIGVRVRYAREERDHPAALADVRVPTPDGASIPLGQLATVQYVRGPQVIKSEDTFLTGYVIFDREASIAPVDLVERARGALQARQRSGQLELPAGVSYRFAGSYEDQVRSEARLAVLVPLALLLIFVILYVQFGRASTTVIIGSGVVVAISGGMGLIWLYNQPWFLDAAPLGIDLRELLQVGPMNLSVAVWVGVIALAGIATDDGVVMATYLHQRFFGPEVDPPKDVEQVRRRVLEAGRRRVRPCLMTTATTILALLPVVTSTGRGADVMGPMAVPILGGMSVELITLFVVPVLYSAREEIRLAGHRALPAAAPPRSEREEQP